jgi:hypothetical protein
MPCLYRTAILDHLVLVAGMYGEPGMGEVLDRATPHTRRPGLSPMRHFVQKKCHKVSECQL